MSSQTKNALRKQGGSSLLVSLVMLVVLTLLVVSAIRMSNSNLKTVGNMQATNEAQEAAQQAIEKVMSDANNFYVPAAQTVIVDINNSGVSSSRYTATTSAPVCEKMVAVPGYSADFAESAPKDTYWDVKAVVTDSRTGASATIHQGVKVRMDSTATCS